MRLYLIRHAQSTNNALYGSDDEGRQRDPDPEITKIGHRQAALLGAHVAQPMAEPRQHPFQAGAQKHFGFTHLYCSLMTRTILTANYVAKTCGLQPVALPELFEKGGIYKGSENGRRQGLPGPNRHYFEQRFPELVLPDSLGDAGWYNRPAESEEAFLQRMEGVVATFKERHLQTDHCIAMIAHGDLIDQFINVIMGVERPSANYNSPWVANWAFHNTSISRIDFTGEAQTVVYLNRIDHLPPELVTW